MYAGEDKQLGFILPGSKGMEGIWEFHEGVMVWIVLIVIVVMWVMYRIIGENKETRRRIEEGKLKHGDILEVVWTIIPGIILVLIVYPSFKLLYLLDEVVNPGMTIKVIGNQWYWTYEYSDYENIEGGNIQIDSYMVPTEDLSVGGLRLLEVDTKLVIPRNAYVRFIVTSSDVIHSWAIPGLGVKIDAYPGRLNQTKIIAEKAGIYYGQCSEICGANHAFMPIAIEVGTMKDYYLYIDTLIKENNE